MISTRALISNPPVPLIILWWLYQEHQLQLVSFLDDGFSLEFEWQQDSSCLQDSSQYLHIYTKV